MSDNHVETRMNDDNTEIFRIGHILFSENDPADTMYYLDDGKVGIYKDYGTEKQVKVGEIREGFFGEMAMADNMRRTATAVILQDSCITPIKKEDLPAYFEQHPAYKMAIIKVLGQRIRNLNREYMTACGCISECIKADEAGKPKKEMLIRQMKKIAESVK